MPYCCERLPTEAAGAYLVENEHKRKDCSILASVSGDKDTTVYTVAHCLRLHNICSARAKPAPRFDNMLVVSDTPTK